MFLRRMIAQRLVVEALHRHLAFGDDAGLGEDLDDLRQVLHGVLGVVVADVLRVAVGGLQLGDLLGDLDIAFEDAEVGVGDPDRLHLVLRAPLELGVDAVEIELADARQRGRAPVAEGAPVRAAAIGLEGDAAEGTGRDESVEETAQDGRGHDVQIGDAIAGIGGDDDSPRWR